MTDPDGRTTTLSYDAADELTGVTYSSGSPGAQSFTYTDDGLRASMTDDSGTTTYAYDSLDRPTSQTNGSGQKCQLRL